MELKVGLFSADARCMSFWFQRLRETIAGRSAERGGVEAMRLLHAAQRVRARIELQEMTTLGAEQTEPMLTTIELVRLDGLAVSQPTIGGLSRQLILNVPLRLMFNLNGRRWSGETCSLGRTRMASGGARPLFGYRLALPDDLAEEPDRRSLVRVVVGFDLAPRAEIHFLSDAMHHAEGRVHELSESGALIIAPKSIPRIEAGSHVSVDLVLPEPIGAMTVGAEVRHITERMKGVAIGLLFLSEVPGMPELVRLLEIRRHRRLKRTG